MSGRPPRNERRGRVTARTLQVVLAGLLTVLGGADRAEAVSHLKRGAIAPVVRLPDLDGRPVDTGQLARRTIVLVFGELYHEKTLDACRGLAAALEGEKLADQPVTPLLIVAQNAPAEAMQVRAREAGIRWRVLHDVDRRAFGAYRVAVMPSLVVVDGEGHVVHALAGRTSRFDDIATDALLVSVGRLSVEAFERELHPDTAPEPSEALLRATRITNLARQLARRGLPDLAEEKYVEALEIAPTHEPARLGLGMLHLGRRRLADAELEFRTILTAAPQSMDARLGLAYVQTVRGGDELAEAERILHGALAAHPTEPRAHYLMGLVHEQRHRPEDAAASFRMAAEVLMSQRGAWDVLAKGQTDDRE